MTRMFLFYLVFLLSGHQAFCLEAKTLPIHSIEAQKVLSEDKKIFLEGSVVAVLDFGTVRCQKATLVMDKDPKTGEVSSRTIEMQDRVSIHFTNGNILLAHKGVIDCLNRTGIFTALGDEKVVYETHSEGDENVLMRGVSNLLRGKLVKREKSWELDDVEAEGAVRIDYRPVSGDMNKKKDR